MYSIELDHLVPIILKQHKILKCLLSLKIAKNQQKPSKCKFAYLQKLFMNNKMNFELLIKQITLLKNLPLKLDFYLIHVLLKLI